MKKIFSMILLLSIVSYPVWSQDAGNANDNNEASQEEGKDKKSYEHDSYMMLGVYGGLDYFLSAENSTENYGVFIKMPMHKAWGVEANFGSYDIPITSYKLNSVTYSGHGTEEYSTLGLDVLWFVPILKRHFQVKAGFDYYRLIRGTIADSPGAAAGNCGTNYQICYNCKPNLFGVNLGVNLDVPLYEKFYMTSSLMVKYILNHESESVPIEFRIGLGYRI